MCHGLSNTVLCDVGVIAIALCPPGMMCKLDCLWLSPFLFVSLGEWFAASWGHLVFTIFHIDCWKPGGTRLLTVLHQDFAPKFGLNLIYHLLDLVNCFELLCGIGGYDVSSIWDHPGLFDRRLLPPALTDMGTLDVHFDVSGAALLRVVLRLIMSDDMKDGHWFPVAMTACSRTDGSGCCD